MPHQNTPDGEALTDATLKEIEELIKLLPEAPWTLKSERGRVWVEDYCQQLFEIQYSINDLADFSQAQSICEFTVLLRNNIEPLLARVREAEAEVKRSEDAGLSLTQALLDLLDDTEHRDHKCESANCCVQRARAALARSKGGGK